MTRFAQPGFTAVEILVTLLIGSLLLMGGYQAYSLVIANTKNSRERAVASNYGYDALNQLGATYAKAPCQSRAEANIPNGIIPSPAQVKLNSSRFSVACPYGPSGVTKITTKLNYAEPAREVIHAKYIRVE